MENAKVICKTDAEILLDFKQLKDNGFAFLYSKKENGISQEYVNCNGKIFGPFDYVYFTESNTDDIGWIGEKGEFELAFEHNGKDCKTEKKRKKEGGNEVLSQDEIDQLLTAIAEGEADAPEEEYDEDEHILKLNRKKQEFFCTNKKRYGPYNTVFTAKYIDDEHFQFTYRKRANSHRWYYNLNGKEICSFSNDSCWHTFHYDSKNRAILDQLKESNCIYIDGQKIRCFNKKITYCSYYQCNEHEIIIGQDSYGKYHVKRDGKEFDFCAESITALDNGDIVYCRKKNDIEIWFYNEQQISVPVNGHSSRIYETIITYKRGSSKGLHDVQYFQWGGKEYNGMVVSDIDSKLVWLDNDSIFFLPFTIPKFFGKNALPVDTYQKIREGNYLKLFYGNLLAGRD